MKKVVLLCMILLGVAYSQQLFAQRINKAVNQSVQPVQGNDPVADEKAKLNALLEQLEGTYQLQIDKADYTPVFSTALLEKIRDSRDENLSVSFEIDKYTRVTLLPGKEIASGDYKKLDRVVYISK